MAEWDVSIAADLGAESRGFAADLPSATAVAEGALTAARLAGAAAHIDMVMVQHSSVFAVGILNEPLALVQSLERFRCQRFRHRTRR